MTTVWSSAAKKMQTIAPKTTRRISACEKERGAGSTWRAGGIEDLDIRLISRIVVVDGRGRGSPTVLAASGGEKLDLFLRFRQGAHAHIES
jgi:hypothetical protein